MVREGSSVASSPHSLDGTSMESYTVMKIIVADDLPASALDILRAEGWDIDARSGRPPADLAIDLADADALVVRSATKVTADLIARGVAAARGRACGHWS